MAAELAVGATKYPRLGVIPTWLGLCADVHCCTDAGGLCRSQALSFPVNWTIYTRRPGSPRIDVGVSIEAVKTDLRDIMRPQTKATATT